MIDIRPTAIGLSLAAIVSSCAGADLQPYRDGRSDAALARHLAGKVPGAPVSCLPQHRTTNMEVIDEDTLIYRDGRTTWVQNASGRCYPGGSSGGYALVIKYRGTSDLCRGDIGQAISTPTGTFAGSCSFNEFVPYRAITPLR